MRAESILNSQRRARLQIYQTVICRYFIDLALCRGSETPGGGE